MAGQTRSLLCLDRAGQLRAWLLGACRWWLRCVPCAAARIERAADHAFAMREASYPARTSNWSSWMRRALCLRQIHMLVTCVWCWQAGSQQLHAQEETEPPLETDGDDSEQGVSEPKAPEHSTLSAQLRLGVGATQRAAEAPSADGMRRLDLGPTPAISLAIDSDMRIGAFQLGVGLDYRTSVLGRLRDVNAGPNADASQTAVRSHRVDAGARAGLVFGSEPSRSSLSLFVGYGVRAFASVAVLRVPRYSLHGPLLRLALDLPLPAAQLRLRLAPELHWLPAISAALRDVSDISGSALAVGGYAALLLPLSPRFALQLEYRESHAWAAARAALSFRDMERYLLLGAAYAWL